MEFCSTLQRRLLLYFLVHKFGNKASQIFLKIGILRKPIFENLTMLQLEGQNNSFWKHFRWHGRKKMSWGHNTGIAVVYLYRSTDQQTITIPLLVSRWKPVCIHQNDFVVFLMILVSIVTRILLMKIIMAAMLKLSELKEISLCCQRFK